MLRSARAVLQIQAQALLLLLCFSSSVRRRYTAALLWIAHAASSLVRLNVLNRQQLCSRAAMSIERAAQEQTADAVIACIEDMRRTGSPKVRSTVPPLCLACPGLLPRLCFTPPARHLTPKPNFFPTPKANLNEALLLNLLCLSREALLAESTSAVVDVAAPVAICGDIHGQLSDLWRQFDRGARPAVAQPRLCSVCAERQTALWVEHRSASQVSPPAPHSGRTGQDSLRLSWRLRRPRSPLHRDGSLPPRAQGGDSLSVRRRFSCVATPDIAQRGGASPPGQLKYPSKVTLLRGNHECASVNRIYGKYFQVRRDVG